MFAASKPCFSYPTDQLSSGGTGPGPSKVYLDTSSEFSDGLHITVSRLTLLRFYNCVWLVLNDIIIGVAFGSFLCENCHVLGGLLDSITQVWHQSHDISSLTDYRHSTIS